MSLNSVACFRGVSAVWRHVGLAAAALWLGCETRLRGASTWYVTTTGAGLKDGSTWDNAFEGIQAAIDAGDTLAGDEVVVAPGVYDQGGRKRDASRYLTNRVVVSKSITVRSRDNDPSNTIIQGVWHPVTTNGPSAVRPVYLAAGARLLGFTLANGATVVTDGYAGLPGPAAVGECGCGGGVYAASATAVISNCLIIGNAAYGDANGGRGGGGAYGGTYHGCRFIANVAGPGCSEGGGAFQGEIHDSHLTGNRARFGGGARNSTLFGCVISNNQALAIGGTNPMGGGIEGSSAYGCTIVDNVSTYGGGGVAYQNYTTTHIVSNCWVARNKDSWLGAGVYSHQGRAMVVDSVIVSNTGAAVYRTETTNCVLAFNTSYGAVRTPSLVNCLVYGNGKEVYFDATWYPSWRVESCTIVGNAQRGFYVGGGNVLSRNNVIHGNQSFNWVHSAGTLTFSSTCTTPAQDGWDASNLDTDPELVDPGSGYGTSHVRGDYRLRGSSPCLDAGVILGWMPGAVDLDGNPRIDRVTGRVDLGAYEFVHRATILLLR